MDKVRYAGDLSQEEAPDILNAFPEEEPDIDKDILDISQDAEQPNTSKPCKPTEVRKQSTGNTVVGKKSRDNSMPNLQQRQKSDVTHRYNLRNR